MMTAASHQSERIVYACSLNTVYPTSAQRNTHLAYLSPTRRILVPLAFLLTPPPRVR